MIIISFTSCDKNSGVSQITKNSLFNFCHNSSAKDSFVDNPFSFTILKNYSDDYTSIGKTVDSSSSCPLQKENISDSSFCFLRTINYNGLTIHTFSFDVLQSGTAEYIITNNSMKLRNGITIGISKEELLKEMGKPYKVKQNNYIWRSSKLHNYLVFTLENNNVVKIRWHEERQPEYKGQIVWETKYE
jgi:hypothetical protein